MSMDVFVGGDMMRWSVIVPFTAAVIISVVLATTKTTDETEVCPNKRMIFHPPTHTCFLFSTITDNVEEAGKRCSSFRGGEEQDQPGYLARILESETEVFVLSHFDPSRTYWIGFSNTNQTGANRRQGLPSYKPTEKPNINNVVLRPWGFDKANGSVNHYYICQVQAVSKNPVTIMVPLSLQAEKRATRIKCIFTQSSWTEMQWVNPENVVVASCELKDQRPKCVSNLGGYSAILTTRKEDGPTTESRLGIQSVRRQDAGDWTCRVYLNWEKVGQTTATFRVHEPPQDATCVPSLHTDSLEIVCSTEKIYPQLSCAWQIEGVLLAPGQNNMLQTAMNERYTSTDSFTHYESNCSLLLEKGSFLFRPRQLSVKVTLYPTILSEMTSELLNPYGVSREMTIQIEKPRLPKFKQGGKVIQSVVHFRAGEEMRLVCYVYHGKPNVESTTLECQFPVTRRGEYSETWRGVSTVLHRNATLSMNEKVCRCHGNLLTGRTETTTLRFLVTPWYITTQVNNDSFGVQTSTHETEVTTSSIPSATTAIIDVSTDTDGMQTDESKQSTSTDTVDGTTQGHKATTQKNGVTSGCKATSQDCKSTDSNGCHPNEDDCDEETFDAAESDALALKASASGSFIWLGVGAAIVLCVCVQVVVVVIVVKRMWTQQEPENTSCSYSVNQE